MCLCPCAACRARCWLCDAVVHCYDEHLLRRLRSGTCGTAILVTYTWRQVREEEEEEEKLTVNVNLCLCMSTAVCA